MFLYGNWCGNTMLRRYIVEWRPWNLMVTMVVVQWIAISVVMIMHISNKSKSDLPTSQWPPFTDVHVVRIDGDKIESGGQEGLTSWVNCIKVEGAPNWLLVLCFRKFRYWRWLYYQCQCLRWFQLFTFSCTNMWQHIYIGLRKWQCKYCEVVWWLVVSSFLKWVCWKGSWHLSL